LNRAADTAANAGPQLAAHALAAATRLDHIEIRGTTALAHKCFDGVLPRKDGGADRLLWQTKYICRHDGQRWRIASFVGYLPYAGHSTRAYSAAATRQHVTAGPYTPVVALDGNARIFVLSGQAPLNDAGDVIGDTFEDQTRATLDNCAAQLKAAGLGFDDVFKATIYLTDLADWAAFNAVYRDYLSPPYPARTAVQTGLLPGMRVEIEMWAVRK
jgi:reactive intermediate/imine deaminase